MALVEANTSGVGLEVVQFQDGGHLGDLRFDDAPAEVLPLLAQADATHEAALGTAAYLLGTAEQAFALT